MTDEQLNELLKGVYKKYIKDDTCFENWTMHEEADDMLMALLVCLWYEKSLKTYKKLKKFFWYE